MNAHDFSFLPGYEIATEIGPEESMTLQFLDAGDLAGFASIVSYDFSGSPFGFEYGVFQQDSGLFFQAVNTVPEPVSITLLGIGIGFGMIVGWHRKRRKANASIG